VTLSQIPWRYSSIKNGGSLFGFHW